MKEHMEKNEKSKFWKDINKLCKVFVKKTAKKEKVVKTKMIKKETGKASNAPKVKSE